MKLAVKVGLDLPSLGADHRLQSVLQSAVGRPAPVERREDGVYWAADQFGLQRTKAYRSSSARVKQAILARGSRDLLEEAYFIEKSGMAYTAKMTLLSETTEERMLYSMFSADEASHLFEVRGYLGDDPTGAGNPFLALLSELIEEGDRDSLVFMIQVVLEGWGLTHYRSMASTCIDVGLSEAFGRILKDEARHHGSGMLMFDAAALSGTSRAYIVEALIRFLGMVQAGPQGVVAAVELAKGGLTRRQRVELFTELEAEDHSASRLRVLKNLMIRAGAIEIVDDLVEAGAFRPLAPLECAA